MTKYIFFLVILFSFLNISAEPDIEKWNIAKSTHFIIYYKDAPEDFLEELIEQAEDYYNRITDDLGFRRYDFWLWDNRAKIYIYDNVLDYQTATGEPSWSGGCAQVKEKTIKTHIHAPGFFKTVLPHEMGHIIFREFVGFDNHAIPVWLEEGIASYQQKIKYSRAHAIVKTALRQGGFIPLEKLSKLTLDSTVNVEQAQIFYIEAFSIVDFLIKEFGRDRFVLFCQNLRDKKNLEMAVATSYNFRDIQELEEAWKKYLTHG